MKIEKVVVVVAKTDKLTVPFLQGGNDCLCLRWWR
jgi:hypothetical protein